MSQTPPEASIADVLVVGAGPVGLTLAIDLARRGVAVRIIETLAAPTTESRAIAIHSRSLDHFEALGVVDALLARGVQAKGMQFHAAGKNVAEVDFDRIDAPYPFSLAIAQTDTEAILTERLALLGVEIERATTLSGFSQASELVESAVTRPDGSSETLSARYLVGADGARSVVRHGAGQHLDGQFTGEDFLIGDVEAEFEGDRAFFHTYFADAGTGLVFPLPGQRLRIFAQLPAGTEPNRPATIEWLQSAAEERGLPVKVHLAHWLTRFELKHGQVQQYRAGRVFLVGDAAHIHSPAGALGMNTGIQDAVNLGWKLARELAGASGEALLDSYHAERHPVAAGVITFTNRLSKGGTLHAPIAQRVRNALMHVGFAIPPVADALAETVEQQRVRYRKSPIVGGRGRSLQPGDPLRLLDTRVAAELAETPGHRAVLWGDADAAGLPGEIATLKVTENDRAQLAKQAGFVRGGIVIVRPDGYVGQIGGEVTSTVEDYLARVDA